MLFSPKDIEKLLHSDCHLFNGLRKKCSTLFGRLFQMRNLNLMLNQADVHWGSAGHLLHRLRPLPPRTPLLPLRLCLLLLLDNHPLVSRIVRTIRTNKPYRIHCREFLTDNVKFMSKACLFLSLCVSLLCKHFSYILYLVVLYFFCHCLPVLFSLFVYFLFSYRILHFYYCSPVPFFVYIFYI